MSAPEELRPGGNSLYPAGFLGPLTLAEILAVHPTLGERTVAHAHFLAATLLEDITRIPPLEDCGIQVFRRPGPNPHRELSGGLGFSFDDTPEAIEGLPAIEPMTTVARVHLYRVHQSSDAGHIYEVDGFTADEADEIARTSDDIARRYSRLGLEIAPDLTTIAGQEPDQITLDTVDLGRQRI